MLKTLTLILLGCISTSAQTINVKLTDGHSTWYQPLKVPHRTADTTFWLVEGISQAATIADVENSIYALHHTQGAREANPLFGKYPNRAAYYGITEGVFALEFPFAYKYKREDDALKAAGLPAHRYAKWWIVPVINTAAHGVGVGLTFTFTGR